MALKKISDDLQKHDSEYANRDHARTKYNRMGQEEGLNDEFIERNTWQHKFIYFTKTHLTALLLGAIALLIVCGLVFSVVTSTLSQRNFFNEENVEVFITGPDTVDGGEVATYTVTYKNNNRADLEDVELFLNYSDNFDLNDSSDVTSASDKSAYLSLGKIAGKKGGKVNIEGELYGTEGHVVSMVSNMRYTPENSTIQYESTDTKTTTITSSPVMIDLEGPKEAVSGDEIDYTITYRNESAVHLNDLRIVLELPEDFTILSASPSPSYDTSWEIDSIDAHGTGTIRIHGVIYGDRDDVKRISVTMGAKEGSKMIVFADGEDVLRIIGSPLTVRQSANIKGDVISADHAQIPYTITYRNEGPIGLRDIVLVLKINSEVVDIRRIDAKRGTLDSQKQLITLKAVDVPELEQLEPGEGGSISFQLPLYDIETIRNLKGTNHAIETVVFVDSLDIQTPIDSNKKTSSDTLLLKVDAPIVMTAESSYSELHGSGPLPPLVQEETVYTITWSIQQPLNDLKDTIIESALPTGVVWKGEVDPKNAKISFDQRTQKIIWHVGRVEAASGDFDAARTVQFQVGLTPSLNQIGTIPHLVESASGSAIDLYTNRTLEIKANAVTTQSSVRRSK